MRLSEEEKAAIVSSVLARSNHFRILSEDESKSEKVRNIYEKIERKYFDLFSKLANEWK